LGSSSEDEDTEHSASRRNAASTNDKPGHAGLLSMLPPARQSFLLGDKKSDYLTSRQFVPTQAVTKRLAPARPRTVGLHKPEVNSEPSSPEIRREEEKEDEEPQGDDFVFEPASNSRLAFFSLPEAESSLSNHTAGDLTAATSAASLRAAAQAAIIKPKISLNMAPVTEGSNKRDQFPATEMSMHPLMPKPQLTDTQILEEARLNLKAEQEARRKAAKEAGENVSDEEEEKIFTEETFIPGPEVPYALLSCAYFETY
ncbi:unnamed protein product, partial [Protopolystoma xenopodis]